MPYECVQCVAPLPPAERGKPFILSNDPKGKNFLYCTGNSVVIRDINNPSIADIYTEHSVKTTVAKYAPSGYYIASADKSGKVRIWDTVNKEHLIKYEYQPFSGTILDLAWDGESKRIAVAGEGRNSYAAAFLWDSGSKCGNFTGLGKTVNSIDLKPNRPFRCICGTDDNATVFYKGPPYKFEKTLSHHGRFVNCCRYSPSGDQFATVGADGKVCIYEGKEAELVREIEKAHGGGIYACSWSADGTKLLTASGDKSCKIFDVESGSVVNEFKMGTEVRDQQLGCLWQNEHTLSVSLNGNINYLDPNTNSVRTTVSGHAKNISCLTVLKSDKTILTADYDGNVACWDALGGEAKMFTGKGHGSNVSAIATDNLEGAITVGNDDTLRISSIKEMDMDAHSISLDGQPVGLALAANSSPIVITAQKAISVQGSKLNVESLGFEPSCIAASGDIVAIGNKLGKDCFIYNTSGGSIGNKRELGIDDPITAVAFSPDGKRLAVADKPHAIHVFDTADMSLIQKLYGHRARIDALSFSDNGWLASGNIDQKILVHNFADRKVDITMAHRMGSITGLGWLTDTRLVSSGNDGTLKQWEIAFD